MMKQKKSEWFNVDTSIHSFFIVISGGDLLSREYPSQYHRRSEA